MLLFPDASVPMRKAKGAGGSSASSQLLNPSTIRPYYHVFELFSRWTNRIKSFRPLERVGPACNQLTYSLCAEQIGEPERLGEHPTLAVVLASD